LAQPQDEGPDPPSQQGEGPLVPPDGASILEAEEAIEREEDERQDELASPEAVQEREASQMAYADVSAAEAEELLGSTFPEELASLEADPARYLSDISLVRTFGETVATVNEEGEGSLLEAGIPVRAEDEDGELKKVDLGLQATNEGFEPANPLTSVEIPSSADEATSVGEDGIAVSQAGASGASEARHLGDKDIFFHEVERDTDLLVSPISSGVELVDQLRSAESPETFRFPIALPPGAELHANGSGGAEITDQGEVTAVVPPVSAVDGQGADVPVEVSTEGTTLTVRLNHRDGDFQYPIWLDPAIHENYEGSWYWGGSAEALAAIDTPGVWEYSTNDPTETYILHSTFCLHSTLCSPSGRGLYISSLNRNIPANLYAHWYYYVPGGTTFIPSIYPEPSAVFNPFWRNNNNCGWGNYPQPHDYDGGFDAGGNWTYFETDRAQWMGVASIFANVKGVAFGISSGGGVNIPCWRDLMVGGVSVRLNDPEAPTVSSLSGVPTGWVGSAASFSITANVTDPGLGVRNATIAPEGAPLIYSTPPQSECPGTKTHPCPAFRAAQFNLSAGLFDEGEKTAQLSAYDPTGKTSTSSAFQTKVDRTPPQVTLGGQLAVATEETKGDAEDPEKWDELSLPVYNLNIEAKDGSTASAAAKRSGVKNIEIFLDSNSTPETVPWGAQSCASSSCPMTKTYTLKLARLSAGTHTLRVITSDQVANKLERKIEFDYVPATGIKDEYLLQRFPLPDGQDQEEEDDHGPELAVNLINGNLVYHERDVNVERPSVDLEVERFYNSQLPNNENTEWGDGWTLAQTPDLKTVDTGGSPAADEADLIDSSGALDGGIPLPGEAGGSRFDPALQAMLTKEADGGYELSDESGESDKAVAFDPAGKTEELRTEGSAAVEYDYEAGDLAEIAVEDPGSTTATPDEVKVITERLPPSYASSFGATGTANGQFAHPADVAVDAQDNLWVVDQNNNRLEKFNAKGEFLTKVGASGSGNAQFNRPTALAIDAKGNLWITDAGNKRVQELNEKGEFLRAFGTGGSGNAQFAGAGPEGIAIDAKGNVWVSDTYGSRLQKFSETGGFIKAIGTGQLVEPTGIDVGPSGNVWVTDWAANKVVVFNEAGEFLRQFGTAGSGNGQFAHPDALAIDSKGNVWVGDQNNRRVQEFSQSGEYLAQFGSAGSGPGQFGFAYPIGIAADSSGSLWIADSLNNRVQKWTIPGFVPTYSGAFGSPGTANGQFANPGAIARDGDGDLWILDQGNYRVQEFSEEGKYLSQFGSKGSADGQFSFPTSLTIDPKGNIWVIDGLKIKQFNQKGEFLRKFGTEGEAPGKLMEPAGIAVIANGHVLLSDSWNGWVQEFTEAGEFIKVFAPNGSAPGRVEEPYGLAIGPNGHVWIADARGHRVEELTAAGEFVRQFGPAGSGAGKLFRPGSVAVNGHVWVRVSEPAGIKEFTETGQYLAQFGESGSGDGQFNSPSGMTTDRRGHIWISDRNNHRVQKWTSSSEVVRREEIPANDDPRVDVTVANGLVSSVEGEEAGQNTYAYSSVNLTSNSGPDGETHYEYNTSGFLKSVQLANGTVAAIGYNPTFGRVSSVTVDPAGAEPAKTTAFTYSDEPRRTTVTPPDSPVVTYDIGADGSVLKWSNALKAPEFTDRAGGLYVNRETPSPISAGDQNLLIQAHSEEGIASIQVVANGNVMVDEKICEQNPEAPGIECVDVVNEWVTNTAELAPGILYLEVLITDRLGAVASERFWVNIPYVPPPPPGAPVAPTFADVLHFREDFGLDLDLNPVNDELALNDRVFDLIGAWRNPQTPAGEVARASWERWGVPLRPADVAELEYREWFYNLDAGRIDQWVEDTNPSSFAGYFIDHRAGGIMHIGFLDNQAEGLESLKASLSLVAEERLQVYPTTPTVSYLSVQATSEAVSNAIESNSTLGALVVGVRFDESGRVVHVGTPNVAQVESTLNAMFGPNAPIAVEHEVDDGTLLSGRFRNEGRMRAGDAIFTRHFDAEHRHVGNLMCTAGFGAKDKASDSRGETIWRLFVLTAGHCTQPVTFEPLQTVYRSTDSDSRDEDEWKEVGIVRRTGYLQAGAVDTDAEAIRVQSDGIVPQGIFGAGGNLNPTEPAATAKKGNTVCFSGARLQGISCGPIVGRTSFWAGAGDGTARAGYWVKFDPPPRVGDSGAPVYSIFGPSIGLVSASRHDFAETLVQPLLTPPGMNSTRAPGILKDPFLRPLSLKLGQ
jgi:sugar lactone lactonase YvrE